MPTNYILDAGPLGLLTHDKPAHRVPMQNWVVQQIAGGSIIYVSEVADYEVRRELVRLIRAGKLPASRLNRLDQLARLCNYLPVSTAIWHRAADLWAEARLQGKPTAAAAALDADVLIAAQAQEVNASVVTNNAGHIGRWAPVLTWP
ncbi:MAG: PIN domain-containing protein [Gemmataceae bacterium]